MALKPPPPPVKSEPGSFAWMDWYRSLYDFITSAATIAWNQIAFAGSNLTDIATRLHSSLQNILGTGAYHISSAEATEVTALLTQTGTGAFVRATTPTLVTPIIGAATGTSLDVSSFLSSGGYTVATLPAGIIGMRVYVTDATAPVYNGALLGGGAVVVPVFYNGTQWVSA